MMTVKNLNLKKIKSHCIVIIVSFELNSSFPHKYTFLREAHSGIAEEV